MTKLTIGVFRPSRSGGWEGQIRTLGFNAKVRFTPNDDRANSDAPVFRATLGGFRIGDAWEAHWGELGRTYFRVTLDSPFLRVPLSAALFPDEEGASAQLVWTRPPKEPVTVSDGKGAVG